MEAVVVAEGPVVRAAAPAAAAADGEELLLRDAAGVSVGAAAAITRGLDGRVQSEDKLPHAAYVRLSHKNM